MFRVSLVVFTLLVVVTTRPDNAVVRCAKHLDILTECLCEKGYRTSLKVETPEKWCRERKEVKYNSRKCNEAEQFLSKKCGVER